VVRSPARSGSAQTSCLNFSLGIELTLCTQGAQSNSCPSLRANFTNSLTLVHPINLSSSRGACPVPKKFSDRLIRYEAHLSREFDRTLTQLESLQRMRLGQRVLPKHEVQHSMS